MALTNSNFEPSTEDTVLLNRRMFGRVCMTYLVVLLTVLVWLLTSPLDNSTESTQQAIDARFIGAIIGIVVLTVFWIASLFPPATSQNMAYLAVGLLCVLGCVLVLCVMYPVESLGSPLGRRATVIILIGLTAAHMTPSFMMPLSYTQSLAALLGPFILWFVLLMTTPSQILADQLVPVVSLPWTALPGLLMIRWRTKQRAQTAERIEIDEHVKNLGDELSRARDVHESLFPRRFDGDICFNYAYDPMSEIGGDFVHVAINKQSGTVSMTVLDVVGHGVVAALTVNRMYGEIERIWAEHPHCTAGQLIALLNRYVRLTMSRHDLYATGACYQICSKDGQLSWASAGHPPAFLRREDGSVEDLESTVMLLGVMEDDAFDSKTESRILNPGDIVISYTDGAMEARNPQGEQFGLKQLREAAAFTPPPRNWSNFLSSAVRRHHEGQTEDDILVATLMLRNLGTLHLSPTQAQPAILEIGTSVDVAIPTP